MKIRRRARTSASIPTASMADIAMLLLIFFMSTTIIQAGEASGVRLPGATAGERLRAEGSVRVSVGPRGEVSLNDARVPVERVGALLGASLQVNPALVITLHADARTPYALVAAVLEQLEAAQVSRVTLATRARSAP